MRDDSSAKAPPFWSGLHGILSLLPGLTVACFYLLAARVAMLIGHWPRPMESTGTEQDPLRRLLEDAFSRIGPAAFVTIPVWIALMVWLCRRYTPKQKQVLMGLYALGWMAIGVMIFLDPGDTFDWWAD